MLYTCITHKTLHMYYRCGTTGYICIKENLHFDDRQKVVIYYLGPQIWKVWENLNKKWSGKIREHFSGIWWEP